MDGCSIMTQWNNIYHHQHGLETSRLSMPLTLDPSHGDFHQEIITPNSQALVGPGISWTQGNATRDQLCYSLPLMSPLSGLLANNNVQSQPLDASNNNNCITSTSANSIDQQSLECLFSTITSNPTNNNTIVNNDNDNNHPIYTTDVNPGNNNNNSKKRSNNIEPIQGDQQGHHPTFTIHSSSPKFGGKKRQRNNTNNNGNNFRPAPIKGSSNISFEQGTSSGSSTEGSDSEAMQQMKEMIYRAAAFRPVSLGVEEVVETPKRKNVRISSDPQTVAARQRRERISEKLRVLQKLVPGGSKMDTASMLDEAANYLKFLRNQVKALEGLSNNKVINHYNYSPNHTSDLVFPPINLLQFSSMPFSMQTISASPISLQNPCHVVNVPKR